MKITLWQQFSSNHSGYFWVVGTFQTLDAARNAFTEIRAMLFEIDRWHREHRVESEAAQQSGSIEPLPAEQEFARKYGIQWKTTIDWTNWGSYYLENHPAYGGYQAQQAAEFLIDKAVSIIGCNIIVQNPDQTWMTTSPFEDILSILGAETIGYDLESMESDSGSQLEIHTRCRFTASGTATADRLEAAIRTYVSGIASSELNPPPWKDDDENLEKVLPSSLLLKPEHIDLLKKNWQRMYQMFSLVPSPFSNRMPIERVALSNHNVLIRRQGLYFTLDDMWFHNQALGISALIAWLEVNNCTDIDFKYSRKLD